MTQRTKKENLPSIVASTAPPGQNSIMIWEREEGGEVQQLSFLKIHAIKSCKDLYVARKEKGRTDPFASAALA